MLTCIECRCSILHRPQEPLVEVQHGLCIPCFTKRLESTGQRSLWTLSDVDIELLQQDALIIDEQLSVVGINTQACKRFNLKPVRCRGRRFDEVLEILDRPEIVEWCEANIESRRIERRAMEGLLDLPEGPQWALVMLTVGRGRGSVVIDFSWHSRTEDAEQNLPADVVHM
ncbi:MAG: hypothetical protein ACE366_11325 [Bradymonadia bacterium]